MDLVTRAPAVSIITPTVGRADRHAFTAELYENLRDQVATDWEWLVVLDGPDAVWPEQLRDVERTDPRVRLIASPRRLGAAAARNVALHVATGRFITSVDDDDLLPPHSLSCRLDALAEHRVPWVAARLAHLPVGATETEVWDGPVKPGPVPVGAALATWQVPSGPIPMAPTTLLIDAELLRSVGGWHALPQGEDISMMLAVSGSAPGWMLAETVYVYRKHPTQWTGEPDFMDYELLCRTVAWQRAHAIANRVGQLASQTPAASLPAA